MNEYCLRGDRNLSVSSHLTPDPERRLRRMLESLQNKQTALEHKLFFSALIAVIELFAVSRPIVLVELLLCLTIFFAFIGMSALIDFDGKMKFLDNCDMEPPDDYIFDENDLSRYSKAGLVNFLDKYLGGGISATPYYEDLVSRIATLARKLVRMQRVFLIVCLLICIAQIIIGISICF